MTGWNEMRWYEIRWEGTGLHDSMKQEVFRRVDVGESHHGGICKCLSTLRNTQSRVEWSAV